MEAGITEVWNPLVSGRLKVMASLTNWFREFRKYHRDDKGSGKIVKRDDHLMDATRYLIISGRPRMCTRHATAARTGASSPSWGMVVKRLIRTAKGQVRLSSTATRYLIVRDHRRKFADYPVFLGQNPGATVRTARYTFELRFLGSQNQF